MLFAEKELPPLILLSVPSLRGVRGECLLKRGVCSVRPQYDTKRAGDAFTNIIDILERNGKW